MKSDSNFQNIFTHLKSILIPYGDELTIETNEAGKFYLNTKFIMPNKKVMFFGAATLGKNYVSFHLMPIYVYPELLNCISSDLKKRMQGKSCFNFKVIDTKLFAELTKLTKSSYIKYKQQGYV